MSVGRSCVGVPVCVGVGRGLTHSLTSDSPLAPAVFFPGPFPRAFVLSWVEI